MYSPAVNRNKWQQTEVPQKVLRRINLIKRYEAPGLQDHGEEHVVMKEQTGEDHQAPLRDEHQECHDVRGLLVE